MDCQSRLDLVDEASDCSIDVELKHSAVSVRSPLFRLPSGSYDRNVLHYVDKLPQDPGEM
jgi:hypothetical protein